MTRLFAIAALVFGPMLLEARRSRRNEQALRAAGAVEPRDDVYPLMQVAYPGCFLAMLAEGWFHPQAPAAVAVGGAAVFAAAKGLKYWAIATLGPRWTFRVLVPPASARITAGPYRWMRHPNYAAVAGELAGTALLAHAPAAGVLSVVAFGALMAARIAIEERALDVCGR